MEHNSTATAAAASTVSTTCSNLNSRENSNNKEQSRSGGGAYMGVPIHSQVMKIKQEIEKIKHPSLQQPEMRRVLLRDVSRLRSRSPLGLAERAILVGNS